MNSSIYGPLTIPIIVLLALGAGAALGQFWRMRWMRMRLHRHAKLILADAHREGRAQILDAQLRVKQLLLDGNRKIELELERAQEDLKIRERLLDERTGRAEKLDTELQTQAEDIYRGLISLTKDRESLDKQIAALAARLTTISSLSESEARQIVLDKASAQVAQEIDQVRAVAWSEMQRGIDSKASKAIITALERLSRNIIYERSTVLVPVPDAEMRGRIIGRDGRNVRAFEAITGVDVLLEELPDHAVISCHDPFRREVAKSALQLLIQDGRIQPSRIEQVVTRVKLELEEQVTEWGRASAEEFQIHGLHEEVLATLGRLKLRTSMGQNVLQHLKECSEIAGLLAAELRLSASESKELVRASLLHDIGKALPDEAGLSHALTGARFLEKYGESPVITNAVAAHHGEVSDSSIVSPILRAVDALSGARPGARREDYQATLRRIDTLETIALSCFGVEKAYALQAGRELHVIVDANRVSEQKAEALAFDIATSIQRSLAASAPVKISVVRQTRAVSMATWKLE